MSLKKYTEKRHFDRTPEPAPTPVKSGKHPLQFCVQRHDASHLHYDFRLEHDGALKSWAVPKGPTLDPVHKRLAMMVEDHPLEYGGFEGVIPKGNYGGGSVMLWDRGAYDLLGDATADEQLARGDFKFHLHGEKLNGDFALVRTKRGKGNEWLLLKKKDAAAQPGWDPEEHNRSVLTGRTQEEIARELPPVKKKPLNANPQPLPKNLQPMLAQLGKGRPPATPDWIYEVKWDGVRALCYLDNGDLRLISRNGNSMERQYPELSVIPHHIAAATAILDGEIAALDKRGLPSFELLQSRINVAEASSIALLVRKTPVVFFAFDLLYLDGEDLRGRPLIERKRLLKNVLKPDDVVRYSEDFPGPGGPDLLEAARAQGLEGIVGKRANSFYESRRTSDWIKFKVTNSADFVLCGFTKGERDYFGALILGIHDHGKLHWAGNVGTGFDRKMMELIHARLTPLITPTSPLQPDKNLPRDATWTRPELVCEVKFSNWTEEGRLRAPVFLGLRPDLNPEDSIREPETDPAPQPPAPAPSPKIRDRGKPSPQPHSPPPLLDPAPKEATLEIDAHPLKFTNLPKIFYPQDGYTKRDLLNYYDAVSPLLLPHLHDRPLSLKRYPNGIDADYFFQKEAAPSFPKWLNIQQAPDGIRYVIGDDRATLLYLVNLGCIDHNPWMSRTSSYHHPDYVLIDLDPYECPFEKIIEAALLVRTKLDLAELESYPKTTGGDGLHLYVPLEPNYTYDQVRAFAELLAALVAAERPDLFTTPRKVEKRQKGRVYFDWMQIAEGKTISSPYSARAYPGAPVATPLAWSEVTPGLHPTHFNIRNTLPRFDHVGDLFEGVLKHPQTLESALEKLARATTKATR